MGTKSMQLDSTHIILDAKKNIFATFGHSIVGNITTYTNSDDDEEEKKKKEDQANKKEEIMREEVDKRKEEKKVWIVYN